MRWLAAVIAGIAAALAWIAPDDSYVPVIAGLVVALLVVPLVAILLLRRHRAQQSERARSRESSTTPHGLR